MKTLSYIEYCALPPFNQFLYNIYSTILKVVFGVWNFIKQVGRGIVNFFVKIGKAFQKMYLSFKYGDIYTKLSFGLMGVSHIKRGQIVKGIFMLLFEILFIVFMVVFGGSSIYKFTYLGKRGTGFICSGVEGFFDTKEEALEHCVFPSAIVGDYSERNLLFGILSIIVVAIFVIFYVTSVNRSYEIQTEQEEGKHIPTFVEDISEFLNSKFHITLLADEKLRFTAYILPLI